METWRCKLKVAVTLRSSVPAPEAALHTGVILRTDDEEESRAGRLIPLPRVRTLHPSLRAERSGAGLFVLALILIFSCLTITTTALAQTDQIVYNDSLVNGWQNWSWATVNLSNTIPVQFGTDSISVSAGPYQALYLEHDDFDSSLYGSLVFWINGGPTGGQLLQVQALVGGTARTVVTLPALAANTWQEIAIPLASLGAQHQPDLDGFWIQDRSGKTQPAFYVDTISFTAAPPPSVVNISVDAGNTVRTVDPGHFGINTAVWDEVFDTSSTINLLTAMGNQALRFPGGSLSDDYHWATNTTDGNAWQWATSFTDFAAVATAVGSQVFVTVNYGSGTPAEASGWVSSSNVTNHYGFKYWEVGNEVYGSWETDNNTRPHDPYTYAQRFAQYYSQMKSADPTIKVGAVSVPGEDSYANYTDHPVVNPRTGVTHNGWTPVMLATLKNIGVTPDFLIYHRYPENPGTEDDEDLLLSSGTWSTDAANLRQQLNDYLGAAAANVELDCTENNSVSSSPGKQTTSLVDALFMADSICAAMQTEFNSVMWWDLRNGQEMDGNLSASLYGWREYGDYGVVDGTIPPDPAADVYPAFYAGELLKYFARGGDQLLTAASDYRLMSTCAATRADGTLGLLVINKSATNALNANIAISHATLSGNATLYSYGIPQDNAAKAGTGSPAIVTTPVTGLSTNFSFSFPAYSANVLVFSNGASPSPTTTLTATITATPTAMPTTAITIGPATCDSGNVVEGNSSSTCVFALSNAGFTNHAIVTGITIDDTLDFGVFFTDCQAPGGIPAQSSCSINVTFNPQSTGSYTTHLHVFDNATSSPQQVTITGTGALPMSTTDTITPNPLDFGGSPVGQANEQFLVVDNTGFTNPLVLQTLTVTDTTPGYTGPNEFTLVPADSNCPIEPTGLGPGESCIIAIDLTPDASQVDASLTGTLVVAGNAATSPQTINLTGYAVFGITVSGDCYTDATGACNAMQSDAGFSGQSCLIGAGICTTGVGFSCICQ